MKKTVLYAQHIHAGAHIVDFAGWQMPIHYGSQLQEHEYVRTNAGMFDVSHMGIIDIHGEQSQEFLAYLLANNIYKLAKPGKALYTCMLNTEGGIIDDLIVYYIQENFYRLIVNASTTNKDVEWIKQQAADVNIKIELRKDLAIIAVQGPQAKEKVCALLDSELAVKINKLPRFGCLQADQIFFARTGYTGEDGLEIILPAGLAEQWWINLSKQLVKPIGLGARDTLRLEAGYNLYGSDMDESVSPLEANLTWTVGFEPASRNFIGRQALEQQQKAGISRQLIGVKMQDKGVLRHGQALIADGKQVGVITSGTYSPSLHCGIGFARIALPLANEYQVDIRGKAHAVLQVTPPFLT